LFIEVEVVAPVEKNKLILESSNPWEQRMQKHNRFYQENDRRSGCRNKSSFIRPLFGGVVKGGRAATR
jgi:hypothetical protein